jgi:hypothetical protein
MNEAAFRAFLAIILIPYAALFLTLLWNGIGPMVRRLWKPPIKT